MPRDAWAVLNSDITAGSDTFTVSTEVDWVQGDKIVVASTSFDPDEAEVRIIAAVTVGGGVT